MKYMHSAYCLGREQAIPTAKLVRHHANYKPSWQSMEDIRQGRE